MRRRREGDLDVVMIAGQVHAPEHRGAASRDDGVREEDRCSSRSQLMSHRYAGVHVDITEEAVPRRPVELPPGQQTGRDRLRPPEDLGPEDRGNDGGTHRETVPEPRPRSLRLSTAARDCARIHLKPAE
jgi:hypothetical protein